MNINRLVLIGWFVFGALTGAVVFGQSSAKYQTYQTANIGKGNPAHLGGIVLSVVASPDVSAKSASPTLQVAARFEVTLLGADGQTVGTESGDLVELLSPDPDSAAQLYKLLDAVRARATTRFIKGGP